MKKITAILLGILYLVQSALYSQEQKNPEYEKIKEKVSEYYKKQDWKNIKLELEKLLKVAKTKEERIQTLTLFGDLYYREKDIPNFLRMMEEVLKLDENNLNALQSLGGHYVVSTNFEEKTKKAYSYYKKAENLFTKDPNTYYILACIHALKNEKDLALKYLDKAIYYGFEEIDSIQKDQDLVNILQTEYVQRLIKNHTNLINGKNKNTEGVELYTQGKYGNALELFMSSLQLLKDALGEDGLFVSLSYNNLGSAYDSKGEHDKAIGYYEKALGIQIKILGENHPDTATSYNNLGFAYHSKGEHDKAIGYYEKALGIQLKILGENHQATATSYNNLGSAYDSKGEHDKAIGYYEKALGIRLKILGENHQATATSYNNLGSAYDSKGEHDKAIGYYEKALGIRLKILGENHPDTAISYNNLGLAYLSKGEHDKAIGYYEKALGIQIKILGENHPGTATSYGNIGLAYKSKGEHDKAIGYYEKALGIQIKILGENHPGTATSYGNIGLAYKSKGEHDKAIGYYEKALGIQIKILGENHPDTANSYNNLGSAYHSKGEHDKAIGYCEKALGIQIKILGENHQANATSYNNLGLAYHSKGEHDKAIGYYEKALGIIIKILGENHPDTAISYNNLGLSYDSKAEYNKAIGYYEKALGILRKFNARYELLTILSNLADGYKITGKTEKEIGILNEAVDSVLGFRIEMGKEDKESFTGKFIWLFERLYKIYLDTNELEKAFQIQEKMRGLSLLENLNLKFALVQSKVDKTDAEAIEGQVRKIEGLYSKKAALVMEKDEKKKAFLTEKIWKEITEEQNRMAYLEEKIKKKHPEFSKLRSVNPPSFAKLEKLLSESKQAYVQFALLHNDDGTESLTAFIVTPKGHKLISLGNNLDLTRKINNLRLILSNRPDERKFVVLKHKDSKKEVLADYEQTEGFEKGKEIFRKELDIKKSTEQKKVYVDKYVGTVDREMGKEESTKLMASLLKELGVTVLSPIVKEIRNSKEEIESILLSPTGVLFNLPYNALIASDGKYFFEKESLILIQSAVVWEKMRRFKTRDYDYPVFAMGHSVYADSHSDTSVPRGKRSPNIKKSKSRSFNFESMDLKNLPGSNMELLELSKLAYGKTGVSEHVYSGVRANKGELLRKFGDRIKSKQYKYSHFSVHGLFYGDNPELNALVLTSREKAEKFRKPALLEYEKKTGKKLPKDRLLKMGEVVELGIESELTVMSACETSLGTDKPGDGIVGLPQGFLMGGSHNVMATLWSVDDAGTMVFMKHFFQKALSKGNQNLKSIHHLRNTQKFFTVSKDKEITPYADPYYWAPFTMFGK